MRSKAACALENLETPLLTLRSSQIALEKGAAWQALPSAAGWLLAALLSPWQPPICALERLLNTTPRQNLGVLS